jgi:hypothetical protein
MAAQASATRKELKLHLSNLPELDEDADVALPGQPPSLEELIQSHGLAELSRAVEAAASHPSSDAAAAPSVGQAAEKPLPVRKSWSLVSRRSSLLDSASKRARRESQGEAAAAAAGEAATDSSATAPLEKEKDLNATAGNRSLFAVWSEAPSG